MKEFKDIILTKINQIFEKTLSESSKYESQLLLLNTYFSWSDFLSSKFPTNEALNLIQEATFDLISSQFNAFSGFYRQGMICLRSALELTGLCVYYFDHSIECKYFHNEGGYKGPLLSELIDKDGFLAKKYYSLFIDEYKIKRELHTEVVSTYRDLSKYVHGRLGKLQTIINVPLNYDSRAFDEFIKKWITIIGLGNTIMKVRFYNDMNTMDTDKKVYINALVKDVGIIEE